MTTRIKKKRKLKVRNIILLILIIIFLVSSTTLVLYYIDSFKNKKLNNKLVDEFIIPTNKDSEENEEEEVLPEFTIDFEKLLKYNDKAVGWIRYNQDKINYPIVQANDNDYYLNRSFDKKYNQLGSIFLDYRNKNLNDRNVVIFGHNTSDGTMFGSLNDIFSKDFFADTNNNYIQIIDTNKNIFTYRIFSYYTIQKEEYYITTDFKDDNEFQKFINTIINRSYKNFNIQVQTTDNILTLSTCHGSSGTSERTVIHAKRLI